VPAILGKLACSLAAPKGARLTIGLGMMPRGEVGLIFAGIGAKLFLDDRLVVEAGTYARPRATSTLAAEVAEHELELGSGTNSSRCSRVRAPFFDLES
jgi:hypothetical protein